MNFNILKLANTLASKCKIQEAVDLYRYGISIMPDFFWYHYLSGKALAKLGQLNWKKRLCVIVKLSI